MALLYIYFFSYIQNSEGKWKIKECDGTLSEWSSCPYRFSIFFFLVRPEPLGQLKDQGMEHAIPAARRISRLSSSEFLVTNSTV